MTKSTKEQIWEILFPKEKYTLKHDNHFVGSYTRTKRDNHSRRKKYPLYWKLRTEVVRISNINKCNYHITNQCDCGAESFRGSCQCFDDCDCGQCKCCKCVIIYKYKEIGFKYTKQALIINRLEDKEAEAILIYLNKTRLNNKKSLCLTR